MAIDIKKLKKKDCLNLNFSSSKLRVSRLLISPGIQRPASNPEDEMCHVVWSSNFETALSYSLAARILQHTPAYSR